MSDQAVNAAYLEGVRREHDELRELLGELHKVLGNRLEHVAEVAERLQALSEHVETHFTQEEVGGLFDGIVDRAPRLSSRVEDLRGEHAELLEVVRALHKTATTGDGSSDWWQQLDTVFHNFSTELMHHESTETQLLQDAYTEDIGAAD